MNKKEQKIIKEIMRRNDLNVVYYDDLEGWLNECDKSIW